MITNPTKKSNHFLSDPYSYFAIGVIFLVSMGLYAPSLSYDYLPCDHPVIAENEFTSSGACGLYSIFSMDGSAGYIGDRRELLDEGVYRPLGQALYALEYELVGPNPTLSRWVNLLLFTFSGIMIFYFLRRYFFNNTTTGKKVFASIPFLAALLFVIHPLQTEVVAGLSGREFLLAFSTALAGFYGASQFQKSGNGWYLLLLFTAMTACLFSSEWSVLYVFLIPLALHFFEGVEKRRFLLNMGTIALSLGLFSIARLLVMGNLYPTLTLDSQSVIFPLTEMSILEQYATILYTFGKYVQLVLLPFPQSYDYSSYSIPLVNWSYFPLYFSLSLYLAMWLYGLYFLKKKAGLSFFVLYWVLGFTIVSQAFFMTGVPMDERFVYLFALPFCVGLPWLLIRKIPQWLKPRKWAVNTAWIILACYFVALTILTVLRIPAWSNASDLNAGAVVTYPDNYKVNFEYGLSLYHRYLETETGSEQNRLLNRSAHYAKRSKDVYSEFKPNLELLSKITVERYRNHGDLSRLLFEFREILFIRPQSPFIQNHLETILRNDGSEELVVAFLIKIAIEDLLPSGYVEEAFEYLNIGSSLYPDNPEIHHHLERMHNEKEDQ